MITAPSSSKRGSWSRRSPGALFEGAKCDKQFHYIYSFEDSQICTSVFIFFLALGLTEWFSDSRDERNSALNHSRRLWRDKTFAASISLLCKLHIFERAITWKKTSNQLNVNPSAKKNDSTIMSALKNGRKQLTVNPSAKKNGRKWLTVNPSLKKNGWTKNG